jgi:putative ABC transport system substrate-binding protein
MAARQAGLEALVTSLPSVFKRPTTYIDRRRFLLTSLAGALAAPLAARAQPRRAIIGVLHVSAVADAPAFPAFRDGLRDLGYVEGKNVVLDYRWPHDRPEQLSSLAAALVQSKVDIIVAGARPLP